MSVVTKIGEFFGRVKGGDTLTDDSQRGGDDVSTVSQQDVGNIPDVSAQDVENIPDVSAQDVENIPDVSAQDVGGISGVSAQGASNVPSVSQRSGGNAPDTSQQKSSTNRSLYPVYDVLYDGEKAEGDMGSPIELTLDYHSLATRSWDLFLRTSFVSIVLDRYIEWIIGKGLQLQSTPNSKVLESEGYSFTDAGREEFTKSIEARFRLWAESPLSDEKEGSTFHKINCEIIKNSFLAGDCLVIYRIGEHGLPTVDYLDGRCVRSPLNYVGKNKLVDGVELDSKGRHVAYWVQTSDLEYTPIAARDKFGRIRAELVYWERARSYDVRGLSGLHGCMHMLTNMDRYIDSNIEGAVSQSNVAYFVTKDKDALVDIGPMFAPTSTKNLTTTDSDTERKVDLNQVKRSVIAETSKQMYELPPGYNIEMPAFSDRTQVENFISVYFNFFVAALGIPPEVALQLYTNSFSASRMATKGWEHTLRVKRSLNTTYKNAFRLLVDLDVWNNKVDLPIYKQAVLQGSAFAVEALVKCKLIGANVPHADPVKEAKAHRILLGNDDIPLESASTATESLGTGEYEDIQEVVRKEKRIAERYEQSGTEPTE